MVNNKETKRSKRKKSLIYGLFFVVMGIAFIVWSLVSAYSTQEQIENWVAVEGTIVDTKVGVKEISGWGGSRSYEGYLKVTFRYGYGGKIYEDEARRASVRKDGREAAQAYMLDRAEKSYTIGSTQTLYVNPSSPQQIVSSISFTPSVVLGILGLVSAIIGSIVWKFHLH